MKLSELSITEFNRRLREERLIISTGPVNFRIISSIKAIADGLRLLYADYPVAEKLEFADFTITLSRAKGLRRWWRPQVNFLHDGEYPFAPLPLDHAYPMLEWAMNWCISTHVHHYLTVHAAALEYGGKAVVMPAPPGSGKSTLCAGLASRGWRLLSDELTLISLKDGLISPLGRPISLKNASLEVISEYIPTAIFGRVTQDTSKGSVGHMKISAAQVARLNEKARPKWIIFPRYVPDARAELTIRSKAISMLELGRNAFNYSVLGLSSYELLSDIVSSCNCYNFNYSKLDDAISIFDRLVNDDLR